LYDWRIPPEANASVNAARQGRSSLTTCDETPLLFRGCGENDRNKVGHGGVQNVDVSRTLCKRDSHIH
jgi:hypothetical protein